MTRKELRKRAAEMKRKLCADYDKALENMIHSSCVDLQAAPDDYSLIKDFICAFCEDQASARGYGPGLGSPEATRKSRANIKNIRACT